MSGSLVVLRGYTFLLGLGLRGSSQGEDLCSSLTIPWLYVRLSPLLHLLEESKDCWSCAQIGSLGRTKITTRFNWRWIRTQLTYWGRQAKQNYCNRSHQQDKNNLHKTRYPWSCFLWQRTSILSGGIREVLPRLPIWAQDQQSLLSSSKWRSGESRTYSQGIVREEQRSSPCTAELPRNPNPRRKV